MINGTEEDGGEGGLVIPDYSEEGFFGESAQKQGDAIQQFLDILSRPEVQDSMDSFLKDMWKFIRLSDDMHKLTGYLNDIRICFIALTVSGYVGILIYALIMCVKRRKPSSTGSGDKRSSSVRRNADHYHDIERDPLARQKEWDDTSKTSQVGAYRYYSPSRGNSAAGTPYRDHAPPSAHRHAHIDAPDQPHHPKQQLYASTDGNGGVVPELVKTPLDDTEKV